ncbi:hypothetical protein BH23ACT9_BH23ACT9_24120 [soil metagenome]
MTLLHQTATAADRTPEGMASQRVTPHGVSQRLATRTGQWLARRRPDRGRRSFMARAAMIGTALAVNPFDFILRPQSAYASICGPANECNQGWTAFCCTVNGGANTCPDGSYAAGWWKVTSSAFCNGGDRYIVDCNRLPSASCSCRCATGECDRRRVCCNNFRYGQCNQQIAGTTQVVCRIIICTPPWEWDDACTTTVRTDNRTADHSASCLPGRNPTQIEIVYQDLGLVGSILGRPVGPEADGPAGGSWRLYDNGAITRVEAFGIVVLAGPAGVRYGELAGPNGALGWLTGDPTTVSDAGGGIGQVVPAERGALYETPDRQAFDISGPLQDAYNAEGGPAAWLGFPVSGVQSGAGDRQRVDFAAGWSLVNDPSSGQVRLLPADVEVPSGSWPATAEVDRWSGDNRVATAIEVSIRTQERGAGTAILAAAGSFADALAGGVLAGIEGGPVLLTGSERLDATTADELRRLGVDRVVLVGGPGVLAERIEDDLAAALRRVTIDRLSGDSRFATAVAVSEVIAEDVVDTVYLTSGREFADALAASPAAARAEVPLLLTEAGELPPDTAAELDRLRPDRVIVVGGTSAVSDAVATAAGNAARADVVRIAGPSRFDTAAALVEEGFDGTVEALMVATGDSFADALAAGAASVSTGMPLLLVTGSDVPRVTRRQIERLRPDRIVIVGGDAAVAAHVGRQLAAIPTASYTSR